jgi:phospholipase C
MELNKSPWMVTAEELFLGEFDEPKEFYENFTSAVELYYELSNRIVALADSPEATEMSAYSLMYETYMSDMRENSKDGLGSLLYLYQLLDREVHG